MAERWTTTALKAINAGHFAQAILNERRNELKNPYSPLAQKLGETQRIIGDIGDRLQLGEEINFAEPARMMAICNAALRYLISEHLSNPREVLFSIGMSEDEIARSGMLKGK